MSEPLKPHPVVPLAEMDIQAFFNLRDWLERALEAAGARTTGGGMGLGAADVSIEMDGFGYVVSIRPLGRWAGLGAVAEGRRRPSR